jgi:lipopolysaccharide/colanic/teichoic acid biosynthesis glycosyltransferase
MLDFLVALTVLLAALPLLLVLIILLKVTGHKRVFFLQQRVGLNDKIFVLMKFRSMTEKCGADGKLLPDAARLTAFGKLLRRSSLDELPQLINVLKGDMSIVGPRPLLVEYLQYYSVEQKKRHQVRPGITGWAQVNGRNAISWEKKFELDVWYVKNINFMIDCRVLFKTILKVIKPQGISQEGQATMEAFRG